MNPRSPSCLFPRQHFNTLSAQVSMDFVIGYIVCMEGGTQPNDILGVFVSLQVALVTWFFYLVIKLLVSCVWNW